MKNVFRRVQIIFLSAVVLFQLFSFFAPAKAFAQVPDVIDTTKPASASLPVYNSGVDQSIKDYLCTPTGTGTDLFDCVNRLYRFGISAGAIMMVFFLVYAGYLYIISGEAGKTKAKSVLISTLTGMAIMLGSYMLLSFINPNLVQIKTIQPPIFSNVGLPSCEAIGFGDKCIISTGSSSGQVYDPSNGTRYGGKSCTPITNNASPASIDNLTNSCFGKYGAAVVKDASIVASSESGGNPSLPVGAGSCGPGKPPARCVGGEIPVWGLYQINLTNHKVGGLNCPAAFSGGWTCSKQCTVINKDLYNQCVVAAKNATNNINTACQIYQANISAGRPGFNDWGNTANEHGKRCGF